MKATTVADHQEHLRKAFCMENDYDSVDDTKPEELQQWLDQKLQTWFAKHAEEKNRKTQRRPTLAGSTAMHIEL